MHPTIKLPKHQQAFSEALWSYRVFGGVVSKLKGETGTST